MDPRYPKKLLASITTNKNAHAFVPCQPCTRLDVVRPPQKTGHNGPTLKKNGAIVDTGISSSCCNCEMGNEMGPAAKIEKKFCLEK